MVNETFKKLKSVQILGYNATFTQDEDGYVYSRVPIIHKKNIIAMRKTKAEAVVDTKKAIQKHKQQVIRKMKRAKFLREVNK